MENSWKKYGEQAFEFKIIELCSKELLTEREQHWLDFYQCRVEQGGFNFREPTDNPNGPPVSDETKKKMSLSKGFKYEAFGESLTLTEWQERTGINRDALRARILRGKTIEEALTAPHLDRRIYSIAGVEDTLPALSRHMKIPLSRVKNRVGKGWCLTKALLLPKQRLAA